ncbi:hypothetical protein Aca07nite_03120 [Actinoplanes capillaceus]|uniref:TIR domain-containing protein n=1 Tax=Actinoplanes campanulatus TaxID=113559 RepID=A0ABQ3WAK4_9ACTN|nr:TIR domain-containing protein [Actinoplanes capillaceus]GID43037.1 hypothetical protein Aca07nite_03120 [Actinoplanes capillaceus]
MTARTRIFISFRTNDGDAHAAHLDHRLSELFGAGQVFRSSRVIRAGVPFRQALEEGLASARITLVLIGRGWADLSVLSRPGDWVRREVRESLEAGIPVVPVLLDKARMPLPGEIPEDLHDLLGRQYRPLRNRLFDDDFRALAASLHESAPELAARHFTAAHPALGAQSPPSALLRAEHAVVPFHGRAPELADLTAWRDQPGGLAVAVVTGPAGQGKTRLAAELCARTARGRTAAVPWVAGPLDPGAAPSAVAALSDSGVPVLAVFDQAEESVARIAEVLTALARRRPGAAPARVLLVARTAGPWRERLTDEVHPWASAEVLAARQLVLTGVPDDVDTAFEQALGAYAKRLGIAVPQPPPPAPEHLARPLDVHTAALLTLSGMPIDSLLIEERRYWSRSAGEFDLDRPGRLRLAATVAATTLYGGQHRAAALAVLTALLTFQQEPGGVVDSYLRWVMHLYPAGDAPAGTTAPHALRPDRVGEDHVARTVLDQPDLIDAARVADFDQKHRALLVLGNASARHPALTDPIRRLIEIDPVNLVVDAMSLLSSLEAREPTLGAVTRLVDRGVAPLVLHRVLDSVPAELPECAALVRSTVRRLSMAGADDLTMAVGSRLLARSLLVTGQTADALRASARAVELARDDPMRALALHVHADALAAIGRTGESAAALAEAIRLLADMLPPPGKPPEEPSEALRSYAASGRFADPERLLRTLVEDSPDHRELRDELRERDRLRRLGPPSSAPDTPRPAVGDSLVAALGLTEEMLPGADVTAPMLLAAAWRAGLPARVVRVAAAEALGFEAADREWCLYRDPATHHGWFAAPLHRDEFGEPTIPGDRQLLLGAADPEIMLAEAIAWITEPEEPTGWMRLL